MVEDNAYYPFGLKIAAISSKAFDAQKNPYQYQGDYAEYDDETGYNEFELRSYDPQIGRFIQVDPYEQFPSPYIGMGNEPVNNVDPSGGWLEGLSAVSQFAVKHFAPALIGAAIGAATTKGDASDKLRGAGIGFGIGLAASYVATEVNWSSVGGLFQELGIDWNLLYKSSLQLYYREQNNERSASENELGNTFMDLFEGYVDRKPFLKLETNVRRYDGPKFTGGIEIPCPILSAMY